jgi:hypothetical protein
VKKMRSFYKLDASFRSKGSENAIVKLIEANTLIGTQRWNQSRDLQLEKFGYPSRGLG